MTTTTTNTDNAANTLARLQLATLEAYARAHVSHDLTSDEQEQEWASIREVVCYRAKHPNATWGDTWTLIALGYKSPFDIIG